MRPETLRGRGAAPLAPRGFTLVELMIVVTVVAILASIAIPSYQRYVIRASRSEAKSALLSAQAAQEKFYLQNNRYAGSVNELGISGVTDNGNYIIGVGPRPGAGNQSYVINATPANGKGQERDIKCLQLSIDETGNRQITGSGTVAECWR